MDYTFIQSDVIRNALETQDTSSKTLKACLDLMAGYLEEDLQNESVSYDVYDKREAYFIQAEKCFEDASYLLCLGYIEKCFSI